MSVRIAVSAAAVISLWVGVEAQTDVNEWPGPYATYNYEKAADDRQSIPSDILPQLVISGAMVSFLRNLLTQFQMCHSLQIFFFVRVLPCLGLPQPKEMI